MAISELSQRLPQRSRRTFLRAVGAAGGAGAAAAFVAACGGGKETKTTVTPPISAERRERIDDQLAFIKNVLETNLVVSKDSQLEEFIKWMEKIQKENKYDQLEEHIRPKSLNNTAGGSMGVQYEISTETVFNPDVLPNITISQEYKPNLFPDEITLVAFYEKEGRLKNLNRHDSMASTSNRGKPGYVAWQEGEMRSVAEKVVIVNPPLDGLWKPNIPGPQGSARLPERIFMRARDAVVALPALDFYDNGMLISKYNLPK